MTLSHDHLVALRSYLKEFKATSNSTDPEHLKAAEVLNELIPALVDSISDEDLTNMTNQMWEFVMTGLVTKATGSGEPTNDDAETTDTN